MPPAEEAEGLVQNSDVRVLTDAAFQPTHTWKLQAGDMLYVERGALLLLLPLPVLLMRCWASTAPPRLHSRDVLPLLLHDYYAAPTN